MIGRWVAQARTGHLLAVAVGLGQACVIAWYELPEGPARAAFLFLSAPALAALILWAERRRDAQP